MSVRRTSSRSRDLPGRLPLVGQPGASASTRQTTASFWIRTATFARRVSSAIAAIRRSAYGSDGACSRQAHLG
jgi:hypothetical protein